MAAEDVDLNLDAASVAKFTKGVGATIDGLGDLGGATGSVMGKGFSQLSMTGMETGHHGLSIDFEDFCERWEWGVRALVNDASQIANRLGLAAGTLWEHDQYVAGSLKVGVNALTGGNPHASEEEIARQDWGEVFTPDAFDPDWSRESFERAGEEIEQTWKDTGRSLLTEGRGGQQAEWLNERLGIDETEWNRALDETFGPSPEERARQAQQQGGQGVDGGN